MSLLRKLEQKVLFYFHKKRTVRQAKHIGSLLLFLILTDTYYTIAKKAVFWRDYTPNLIVDVYGTVD